MFVVVEISYKFPPVILEISPIMLALFFMLFSPYFAKTYVNIIDSSLPLASELLNVGI